MAEELGISIPNDIEAERAILSAIMNDREAIIDISGKLDADDFYNPEYKIIFAAIMDLFNDNIAVDFVVLKNRIDTSGYKGTVIDIPFLADIASNVILTDNVIHYAEIVKDKSVLRQVIKSNREVLKLCYENNESTSEILSQVEKNVFDILNKKNSNEYMHIKDILSAAFERIEDLYKNKGKLTGVPTGFIDLDAKTAGLQKSDMILIAARPSMGKSAFAINIVEAAAIKHHVPTAIFSLEMSKEQIVNRIISGYAMIDANNMRTGNLTEEDFKKMADAMGPISKAPIFIDDTPGISISELRAKCRRMKVEHNIGLVVIDYLQLMSGTGKGKSRQEEISEISRNIKAIARELQAPVIALSQLSRACEQRENHRPMLSDLRESGAIEQDADIAMFLYRDEYYNKDSEAKNQGEIIIAKNRNGATGTVYVGWQGQYTKYVNLEKSVNVKEGD